MTHGGRKLQADHGCYRLQAEKQGENARYIRLADAIILSPS